MTDPLPPAAPWSPSRNFSPDAQPVRPLAGEPLPGQVIDEPCRTIADEQRERSDAMADMGVEAFKAANDERDPSDTPRSVAGSASWANASKAEGEGFEKPTGPLP